MTLSKCNEQKRTALRNGPIVAVRGKPSESVSDDYMPCRHGRLLTTSKTDNSLELLG